MTTGRPFRSRDRSKVPLLLTRAGSAPIVLVLRRRPRPRFLNSFGVATPMGGKGSRTRTNDRKVRRDALPTRSSGKNPVVRSAEVVGILVGNANQGRSNVRPGVIIPA